MSFGKKSQPSNKLRKNSVRLRKSLESQGYYERLRMNTINSFCHLPIERSAYNEMLAIFPSIDDLTTDEMIMLYQMSYQFIITLENNQLMFKKDDIIPLFMPKRFFTLISGRSEKNTEVDIMKIAERFMCEDFDYFLAYYDKAHHLKGMSRRFIVRSSGERVKKFINIFYRQFKKKTAYKKNPVYFIDNSKYSDTAEEKRRISYERSLVFDKMQQKTSTISDSYIHADKPCVAIPSSAAVRYMNSLDVKDFDEIMHNIDNLDYSDLKPYEQITLNLLREDINPLHIHTDAFHGRSYAKGVSLQTLKKDIKYRIIPEDTLIIDMMNCHIRILAKLLNLKKLTKWIAENPEGDIYTHLAYDAGYSKEITVSERKLLKNVIVPTLYGLGSEKRAKSLALLDNEELAKLFTLPPEDSILAEIVNGIKKEVKRISEKRYVEHPLDMNQRYYISTTCKPLSLFARKIQYIESEIINDLYIWAMRHKDKLTIISCEHDGCSIVIKQKDRIDAIMERIRVLISESAQYKFNLNMPIKIERHVRR